MLEGQGDAAPEVKAHHAEAAGLTERALDCWEQAGMQALARPAYKEAIASLEKGIRLSSALGEDPQWKRRELGQVQLGQAPATLRTFERALVLVDATGDVSLEFLALYGQWASYYVAGRSSVELAQRFVRRAEAHLETGPRLNGLRILGLERFHEGRFKESLALEMKALDAYDAVAHRDLAHRFGHDPRIAAASCQAWNLWHLGFPDRAARTSEDALCWAREFGHANATGYSLCFGVTIPNIWFRRPDLVESAAREALRISEELSLPLWHAWPQIHLGWALSQQGDVPGLDEIESGLREACHIGAGRFEAFHQSLAADAYAGAGRHDDARASIAKAFAGRIS